MKKILVIVLIALPLCGFRADSYFDRAKKTVHCSEPLPEFTLGYNSNPSASQVRALCSCVWAKFPEGGWERDVSTAISLGKDPGGRIQAFVGRFGEAMKTCGAYKL